MNTLVCKNAYLCFCKRCFELENVFWISEKKYLSLSFNNNNMPDKILAANDVIFGAYLDANSYWALKSLIPFWLIYVNLKDLLC